MNDMGQLVHTCKNLLTIVGEHDVLQVTVLFNLQQDGNIQESLAAAASVKSEEGAAAHELQYHRKAQFS